MSRAGAMQVSSVLRSTGSLRCPGKSFPQNQWTRQISQLWGNVAGLAGKAGSRGLVLGCGPPMRVRALASGAGPSYGGAGTDEQGPRVCILGGGFGGLYTAVKLESLLWPRGTKPRVTLIDQSERFTFKPLLYELLTGAASEEEVAPEYSQLLAPYPALTYVRGRVAAVQPQRQQEGEASAASAGSAAADAAGGGTVVLADGESVPYDWLVLALGAETNTFGIPGVKDVALPFATYEDARRVNARLALLEAAVPRPEVVVVGGGYAGVEVAAVVAERLAGRARVKVVTAGPSILEGSSEGQREAAQRVLQDKGISVIAGAQVTEMRRAAATPPVDASASSSSSSSSSSGGSDQDLQKRVVYLRDSAGQQEILEADLVIWNAGQAPVTKVEAGRLSLPFPTNGRGATQTEPTLRVLGHPNVFAVGDIAVCSASGREAAPLPATAQVAFQQADYAAWNLWAAINHKPLLNFSYQHLGDMMSLGSTNGAVALPIPIPPPLSSAMQAGPLGELLKIAGVRVAPTFGGATDGLTLEGPLAAALRRAAYLYRQPTDQQRLRVASSWAQLGVKTAAQLARDVLAGRGPGGAGN